MTTNIMIVGVGGVGSYVVEALARSGVGEIVLFDSDEVAESNINRQIIATDKTVGMNKTDALEERLVTINPDLKINKYNLFYLPETAEEIDLSEYDFVVDCIDNVTAKLELIERCEKLGVPIISSMGTGNKNDPTAFVTVIAVNEVSHQPKK